MPKPLILATFYHKQSFDSDGASFRHRPNKCAPPVGWLAPGCCYTLPCEKPVESFNRRHPISQNRAPLWTTYLALLSRNARTVRSAWIHHPSLEPFDTSTIRRFARLALGSTLWSLLWRRHQPASLHPALDFLRTILRASRNNPFSHRKPLGRSF
jgi:hypothetical protein